MTDRAREIGARLDAIRARLQVLKERDRTWDAVRRGSVSISERLAIAQRYAADAHAAALDVLASSAEAFDHAADAHERAASVHERAAASGVGDTAQHQRQAAHHREAAAADRRRAEHARSLVSDQEQAGSAVVTGEPPESMAP